MTAIRHDGQHLTLLGVVHRVDVRRRGTQWKIGPVPAGAVLTDDDAASLASFLWMTPAGERRAASDRALAPLVAEYRAKVAAARQRARHGSQRERVMIDCRDLDLLLDVLDPATRP